MTFTRRPEHAQSQNAGATACPGRRKPCYQAQRSTSRRSSERRGLGVTEHLPLRTISTVPFSPAVIGEFDERVEGVWSVPVHRAREPSASVP